jgi:hypothetical protein
MWWNTIPAIANMNMISMFHPTMVRRAVGPGAVQNAERPEMLSAQPFQVSLKKSMPKSVSPAITASQFRPAFAFRISTA